MNLTYKCWKIAPEFFYLSLIFSNSNFQIFSLVPNSFVGKHYIGSQRTALAFPTPSQNLVLRRCCILLQQFNGEYLRSETWYGQLENGIENYKRFHRISQNYTNFGAPTIESRMFIFTHPRQYHNLMVISLEQNMI